MITLDSKEKGKEQLSINQKDDNQTVESKKNEMTNSNSNANSLETMDGANMEPMTKKQISTAMNNQVDKNEKPEEEKESLVKEEDSKHRKELMNQNTNINSVHIVHKNTHDTTVDSVYQENSSCNKSNVWESNEKNNQAINGNSNYDNNESNNIVKMSSSLHTENIENIKKNEQTNIEMSINNTENSKNSVEETQTKQNSIKVNSDIHKKEDTSINIDQKVVDTNGDNSSNENGNRMANNQIKKKNEGNKSINIKKKEIKLNENEMNDKETMNTEKKEQQQNNKQNSIDEIKSDDKNNKDNNTVIKMNSNGINSTGFISSNNNTLNGIENVGTGVHESNSNEILPTNKNELHRETFKNLADASMLNNNCNTNNNILNTTHCVNTEHGQTNKNNIEINNNNEKIEKCFEDNTKGSSNETNMNNNGNNIMNIENGNQNNGPIQNSTLNMLKNNMNPFFCDDNEEKIEALHKNWPVENVNLLKLKNAQVGMQSNNNNNEVTGMINCLDMLQNYINSTNGINEEDISNFMSQTLNVDKSVLGNKIHGMDHNNHLLNNVNGLSTMLSNNIRMNKLNDVKCDLDNLVKTLSNAKYIQRSDGRNNQNKKNYMSVFNHLNMNKAANGSKHNMNTTMNPMGINQMNMNYMNMNSGIGNTMNPYINKSYIGKTNANKNMLNNINGIGTSNKNYQQHVTNLTNVLNQTNKRTLNELQIMRSVVNAKENYEQNVQKKVMNDDMCIERPVILNNSQMLEAFMQGRLCLSCDSLDHPMPLCPNNSFVCPNCHNISHRGNECPRKCRFCLKYHTGVSIMDCLKKARIQAEKNLMKLDKNDVNRLMKNGRTGEERTAIGPRFDINTRPDNSYGRSVYVSNLSDNITNAQLRDAINTHLDNGHVVHIDRQDGYAFVELSNLSSTFQLVQRSVNINFKKLKIQFKKTGQFLIPDHLSMTDSNPSEEIHWNQTLNINSPILKSTMNNMINKNLTGENMIGYGIEGIGKNDSILNNTTNGSSNSTNHVRSNNTSNNSTFNSNYGTNTKNENVTKLIDGESIPNHNTNNNNSNICNGNNNQPCISDTNENSMLGISYMNPLQMEGKNKVSYKMNSNKGNRIQHPNQLSLQLQLQLQSQMKKKKNENFKGSSPTWTVNNDKEGTKLFLSKKDFNETDEIIDPKNKHLYSEDNNSLDFKKALKHLSCNTGNDLTTLKNTGSVNNLNHLLIQSNESQTTNHYDYMNSEEALLNEHLKKTLNQKLCSLYGNEFFSNSSGTTINENAVDRKQLIQNELINELGQLASQGKNNKTIVEGKNGIGNINEKGGGGKESGGFINDESKNGTTSNISDSSLLKTQIIHSSNNKEIYNNESRDITVEERMNMTTLNNINVNLNNRTQESTDSNRNNYDTIQVNKQTLLKFLKERDKYSDVYSNKDLQSIIDTSSLDNILQETTNYENKKECGNENKDELSVHYINNTKEENQFGKKSSDKNNSTLKKNVSSNNLESNLLFNDDKKTNKQNVKDSNGNMEMNEVEHQYNICNDMFYGHSDIYDIFSSFNSLSVENENNNKNNNENPQNMMNVPSNAKMNPFSNNKHKDLITKQEQKQISMHENISNSLDENKVNRKEYSNVNDNSNILNNEDMQILNNYSIQNAQSKELDAIEEDIQRHIRALVKLRKIKYVKSFSVQNN